MSTKQPPRDAIDAAQTRAIDALQAAAGALYDLSNIHFDTDELRAGHYEERAHILVNMASQVRAERRERRKLTARFQSGGRG